MENPWTCSHRLTLERMGGRKHNKTPKNAMQMEWEKNAKKCNLHANSLEPPQGVYFPLEKFLFFVYLKPQKFSLCNVHIFLTNFAFYVVWWNTNMCNCAFDRALCRHACFWVMFWFLENVWKTLFCTYSVFSGGNKCEWLFKIWILV